MRQLTGRESGPMQVRLPDRHKLAPPARDAPAIIADEKIEAV